MVSCYLDTSSPPTSSAGLSFCPSVSPSPFPHNSPCGVLNIPQRSAGSLFYCPLLLARSVPFCMRLCRSRAPTILAHHTRQLARCRDRSLIDYTIPVQCVPALHGNEKSFPTTRCGVSVVPHRLMIEHYSCSSTSSTPENSETMDSSCG